jgi:TolA-binding protein
LSLLARITHRDAAGRRLRRLGAVAVVAMAAALLVLAGCARYNTYYNAKRAYDDAEYQREQRLKEGEDVTRASGAQKQSYQEAIKKAQKLLDEYPGHSLSDDALYLQGKSYQRIASYRMSIRKLDLLFVNFPQTPYLEEALFLQAVNYLMLGDAGRSQDLLDRLERQYPDSRFQSEALRASGDNAYALEDWQDAADAYQAFLERFPRAEGWDDSRLRLGESLFELEQFVEAAQALQPVVDRSLQADRVFRARLLLARCLVRAGDHIGVDNLLPTLRDEAVIYTKQGEVTLVEAENLLAQGERSAGMTLLEGMPEEEKSREVKPVRADLLGRAHLDGEHLEIEDLEAARDLLQEAMTGRQHLEDDVGTQRLQKSVRDFLANEGQLPDAQPERAARMRLEQANDMLFSFERPHRAYDLYATVAADSAADSLVAARALYGAMLVMQTHLENADSAAIYDEQLQKRYPDSPQAYQARSDADADLLAFLLAREEEALRDSRIELEDTGLDMAGEDARPGDTRRSGLRRRQVYLQRRAPLLYPPPESAVLAAEVRRQRELEAARAELDSMAALQAAPGETLRFGAAGAADSLSVSPVGAAVVDTAAVSTAPPVPASPDTVAAPEPEPEKPKPEKPKSWDF